MIPTKLKTYLHLSLLLCCIGLIMILRIVEIDTADLQGTVINNTYRYNFEIIFTVGLFISSVVLFTHALKKIRANKGS